jgi:hypothetical protein
VTIRVAARLVALPPGSVTTTAKLLPLSPTAAAGVVYFGAVAPAIGSVFLCH